MTDHLDDDPNCDAAYDGEQCELALGHTGDHMSHNDDWPATVRDASRQAAGQPAAEEPRYGVDGCTCRPWTNRGNSARWCTPDDTIDMVAGWDPGPGCPRHPAAGPAAPTNHTTEQQARNAVYSELMWPEWNPRAERHGMTADDANQLLDAYRAAILNSAADEIAAVDFHPNAKAQFLNLAQGFARRLRSRAAGAES